MTVIHDTTSTKENPHMADTTAAYDSITRASLEEKASTKWSTYPGKIGAFVAEMDYGVAEPIRQVLKDLDARDLYGYPPADIVTALREATAGFYAQRYGWNIAADHVDTISDVLSGLGAVLDVFAPAGGKVILPTPAYMPFMTLPGMHDREIVEVPLHRNDAADRWDFDFAALDAAMATGGPDGTSGGVLIMCNPHNPIGKVYTREEMEQIAAIVAKHGGRVFSDEIHAPLVYDGAEHVPYATVNADTAAHTITATSHSKSFNTPGLKCAQILFSNDEDLALWQKKCVFTSHGASNPGIMAGTAAYTKGLDWLAATKDYLQGNRDLVAQRLSEELPEVVYIKPSGTYLGWIDCSALGIDGNVQEYFLEHAGIAFTDGELCGAVGAKHVRLNQGLPRPILNELLDRFIASAKEALGK
jgi:cystathionine beta-lyase